MNGLPLHLVEEIFFRLEPKSLAMMQCTSKFMKSLTSDDPNFEIGYSCRVRSNLLNFCRYGANYIFCHPFVSSCVFISLGKEAELYEYPCYIFGSCSGLLLLYIGALFVANPLTKKFRTVDHSGSKLIPEIVSGDGTVLKENNPNSNVVRTENAMCIGFVVDRYQNTKRFKIVCILEMHTMYRFEISDGNCWRLSETTITTNSKSDLTKRMKPVCLGGTLHWLRNDGSIISFNPETEQACFIPSVFHPKPETKLLLAADENIKCLTLVSGTKEAISIYTLLGNPKWTLARRIKNLSMKESELEYWNVVAYDGKRLVVWEKKIKPRCMVHVYDMKYNSWGILGSTTRCITNAKEFCKFTPSFLSDVEEGEQTKDIVASNDLRISYLIAIMGLIDTTE